jgi:hypothetical protein
LKRAAFTRLLDDFAELATPPSTAENGTNSVFVLCATTLAIVVLPEPGGPHRMIDGILSLSMASRSGLPLASNDDCPTISSRVRGRMRSARGAAWPPNAPRLAACSSSVG